MPFSSATVTVTGVLSLTLGSLRLIVYTLTIVGDLHGRRASSARRSHRSSTPRLDLPGGEGPGAPGRSRHLLRTLFASSAVLFLRAFRGQVRLHGFYMTEGVYTEEDVKPSAGASKKIRA